MAITIPPAIGAISGAAPARRAPRAAGGFALPGEAETSAAGIGSPALAGVSLSGLLALQADETDTVEDRRARQHGRAILVALNDLQCGLLGEGITHGQLQDLAALARGIPQAADPRLLAVMAQISLRAEVELARYGLK